MKYLHLTISALFLLFAIVQWNDPDSLSWIFLYLVVAIVAYLGFRGQFYFRLYLLIIVALLITLFFYLPDVIQWFKDGMPSITDSMKASSPYIELVREFFGLLISLLCMTFYLVISKKKRT